jgi:hypothetical protein
MKHLLVTLGLCTLLATETQAAELTADVGIICQQENERFTYTTQANGKLTDLTQYGLDNLREIDGKPTSGEMKIGKCTVPEAKANTIGAIKNWFKQFTKQDDNPSQNDVDFVTEKTTPKAKSGDFEALLVMTQDGDSMLATSVNGLQFTEIMESVSINIGEGIEALLLFQGCLVNSTGQCLVTADYVIEAPDGSTYQQALNTDVWKETPSSSSQWHLTNSRVGFLLQEDADPGLYKVSVTVTDRISNTQLSLTGKVVAEEIAPEDKTKGQ